MNSHTVEKRIDIRAPKEKVWEALTNPQMTREYFFNCKVVSDWKKGTSIIFKGRIFWIKKIELHGNIIDIDPGNLLKYTLQNGDESEEPGNFSTITVTLNFHNDITTLGISDDVGTSEGFEDRLKKSEKDWDKVLKGLKKLVEEDSK